MLSLETDESLMKRERDRHREKEKERGDGRNLLDMLSKQL